jgi:hypothetical protein
MVLCMLPSASPDCFASCLATPRNGACAVIARRNDEAIQQDNSTKLYRKTSFFRPDCFARHDFVRSFSSVKLCVSLCKKKEITQSSTEKAQRDTEEKSTYIHAQNPAARSIIITVRTIKLKSPSVTESHESQFGRSKRPHVDVILPLLRRGVGGEISG